MSKKMYIMRGCPGSGKSTKAKELAGENGVVYSTDDFFMRGEKYIFNPEALDSNHSKNQLRTVKALFDGVSPVVVDNTNTTPKECATYVQMADMLGYEVEFVLPDTPWAWDADELFQRNTHGVPKGVIECMIMRLDKTLTVDDVREWIKKEEPQFQGYTTQAPNV
jgi:NEDD4-binding protein 2